MSVPICRLNMSNSIFQSTFFRTQLIMCRDKQTQCQLLREQIAGDQCCPGGTGIGTSCRHGYPGAEAGCPYACAADMIYYSQQCGHIHQANGTFYEDTHDEADERISDLGETEDTCKGSLHWAGARAAYSANAVAYFPWSSYIMCLLPLVIFLFFIFFGQNVQILFQMCCGALAFFSPIAWSAVGHYIEGCGFLINGTDNAVGCTEQQDIAAQDAGMLVFALVVAAMGMFLVRQAINFGRVVQGFAVGFVVSMWILDLLLGTSVDGQNELTAWMELGIICLFGFGFATWNLMAPRLVAMFGSAVVGTFLCSQIVCMVGYFEVPLMYSKSHQLNSTNSNGLLLRTKPC